MVLKLARQARQASAVLANLTAQKKNRILRSMSRALINNSGFIIRENKKDLLDAKSMNLSRAFIDRLALTAESIKKMSHSLEAIAALADPVGEVIKQWKAPGGFMISKVRVPIGVIAIIYESRPDVTSDCIGLCLKSGNSVILRGGREAINSNKAIYKVLSSVLAKFTLLRGAIGLLATTQRQDVKKLLKLDKYIDLVIPRGGQGLIREVSRTSRIPVIKHYKGICCIYVDKDADFSMAEKICLNAKVQRPGTCNAMETMLIDRKIAASFLPAIARRLQEFGVEIRGCPLTRKILKGIKAARDKDFLTEYLDLVLAVKVVANLEEAIKHINKYSSHHSDAIVTDDARASREFLKRVDSACVYHNASTRLSDGFQFGMGAEMGISTDRLHARGPMALEELTTYKYVIRGKGQIRIG
ncbi:MAG: glutamate-5-semialdehyde dehydrogenase [Candidatus Omnitrophica bacterium]|nr:glutamate-5-semialdehyde dehydrogenase [Candidatus Omnitrophota bacterium]